MKTVEVTITPALAREWLDGQGVNRTIRKYDVDRYARQMERGEWMVTHQGIAFNAAGRLIDGQHRLLAVIKAGTPVTMNVTFGMDDNAIKFIDTGVTRKNADILLFSGHEWIYRDLGCNGLAKYLNKLYRGYPTQMQYTPDEIVEATDYWIGAIRFHAAFRKRFKTNVALSTAAIRAIINGVDYEIVKAYLYAVSSGKIDTSIPNVNWKSPITARETLLAKRASGEKRLIEELSKKYELSIYCFAENKSYAKESVEHYPATFIDFKSWSDANAETEW